jgi:hypothetical protein
MGNIPGLAEESPYYRRHPGQLAKAVRYYRSQGREAEARRAEQQLQSVGRCRICGRTLSDETSLRLGVGPECRSRLALSNNGFPVESQPEADVFAELERLVETARAQVIPRVGDDHLRWAFVGLFDRLRRDVQFLEREAGRYR